MIAAGQSIGNYRVLNKIGTGGMGAVYLAEHPLIGKRVALKVIHRELAGNRDVVSRFFQEARAVNKIGNEHIVEIHDFGVTPEGDHFFIMEYLEGQTLASVLNREAKVDIMRSLHIGAQIAGALAAAHAAGIIHRDLKPDNIMLMARLGDVDFVKVLDFGLAKMFSAATAVKTAAGVLLGTPQYMSPEACESKGDVDHRTDIYALGVLLFQMLTGLLPFDGESMGEVLVKQVTALPPAPRAVNPAIPPSVEQILLRCLAKPVDARFATMMQLREALLDPEAYLRSAPPIAPARSVRADGSGDANTMMTTAAYPAQPRASTEGSRLAPPSSTAPHQQKTQLAMGLPAHQQHTRFATGAHAVQAPTMIAERSEPMSLRRPTSGMPALAQPQQPQMNTMRIATPLGYSSRPPARRIWPFVFGAAVLIGVIAGLVATRSRPAAGSGDGSSEVVERGAATAGQGAGSSAAAGASGSSAVAAAGSAAGSSSAGSASAGSANAGSAVGSAARPVSPPLAMAHLAIDSVPSHALVTSPTGAPLGKTPLVLEWPISDLPVTFEIALPGYKTKQKQTVVNGNTALRIDLERAPGQRPPGGGKSNGSGTPPRSGNDLMRPD